MLIHKIKVVNIKYKKLIQKKNIIIIYIYIYKKIYIKKKNIYIYIQLLMRKSTYT